MKKIIQRGTYYDVLKDTISQDIKIKSNLTEEFEINFKNNSPKRENK